MVDVYGVSPSPILDSAIYIEYYNETTSLGPTTTLYSAGGSQGNAIYYKYFNKDAVIPTKDLMMLQLLKYSPLQNDFNKTICFK